MSDDYISRRAVVERIESWFPPNIPIEWEQPIRECLRAIKYTQAADVAEVVRCRECEGWVATENSDLGLCALTKRVVTRRDYCSEGKRKDGAAE